jgi:hypothetical protein
VFICGAPGVEGRCDAYAYAFPECDDLVDPGGDGRLTGLMAGVTGCPPLPDAVVPVSVLRDHAGLDTKEGGWCFEECEEGMATSQRESKRCGEAG